MGSEKLFEIGNGEGDGIKIGFWGLGIGEEGDLVGD